MTAVSNVDQLAAVHAFNDTHPLRTPVRYWKGVREGDGKTARTRTPAQLLGGHTAVVWLEGVSGCIALTHVDPISEDEYAAQPPAAPRIPDQPDGLSEHYEDDSDLPDPHRAAERVIAYITAWGDGLIDTTDGKPLYARDLEAICREVLDTTPTADGHGKPVVDVHLPA
ncbi:hypothetical protein ACIBCR_14940 [Micromonospora echinospora]|uniref:hypothetical protein n=1 Tax=Micromonospora echinospora TaxID=1877 RepID=UPI0037B92211